MNYVWNGSFLNCLAGLTFDKEIRVVVEKKKSSSELMCMNSKMKTNIRKVGE